MPNSDPTPGCVICDASPLIFLAKANALDLVIRVMQGRVVVLSCVVREVSGGKSGAVEAERLANWLKQVEVIDFEGSLFPSRALSRSDQSSLAWAVENQADWLLADDRLLRHFAIEKGLGVIGFCGLLVKAIEHGMLNAPRARDILDVAVEKHGLMISVTLYRRIMNVLATP